MSGDGAFEPVRFNGWPELSEAFLSNDLQATFILAPLAMKLREEGHKIKVVYLGHRDGTTMMVHKDSTIRAIHDLRGKTVAIPSRYSNQNLIIFKALSERSMSIKDVRTVEMSPPDMPAALASRSVDAIIAGEPIMAKTELAGYGRVLFMTKDVWPEFISCVLAVREDAIRNHRDEVQRLVDGIARSGMWLDQDKDNAQKTWNHRMQAAQFVSKKYYANQDPKLLEFVLSKPRDRVKYTNLTVRRKDFEEIERYFKESGGFRGTVGFDDYTDTSFVREGRILAPFQWEAQK
jgi:NitT/TauT family transport system substrate-binding protein